MKQGLDVGKAEAALKRAAHKAIYGTREERSGRVLSSVVSEVKYDPRSGNLDVRFVTGRTYRYSHVPPDVHDGLIRAMSKGAFFNSHIRDKYDFREFLDRSA